jgi:hypothetical protein
MPFAKGAKATPTYFGSLTGALVAMLNLRSPVASFQLQVLGYQFPSATNEDWDAEWLLVAGRVECSRGRWKFDDPCLLASELKGLATWLRDVPVGGPEREISFMEPNLRFEHVETAAGDALLIHLSQESAPPDATDDERYGSGYSLHIPFSSINFMEAASAVEKMYMQYPVRD